MKTSTIIRFVLAAVFATLSCIGILTGITLLTLLWCVAWLLLMGRSELTKPIEPASRRELLVGIVIFIIFLSLVVTLDVLHLPEPPAKVRLVLAAALWILWMWGIFRRWQREKGKADA
ncbi:MAG: hypothetical protein ABSF60_14630 [Verrucomicrobiota bacterium]|jgi:hypothetical protein